MLTVPLHGKYLNNFFRKNWKLLDYNSLTILATKIRQNKIYSSEKREKELPYGPFQY